MNCKSCGFANVDWARFCTGCGVKLSVAAGGNLMDDFAERLRRLASADRLEGFNLGAMFSEVFKKRSPEEIEEYFLTGTSKATPPIEQVETGWPKPWFFFRVLAFIGAVYLLFAFAFDAFHNTKLIPGLIMMGSLAMPLATVILFFEMNSPRNVSFHHVIMLVAFGGVLSLFVSLFGFRIARLDWLGASQAGIVEEIGKLLAVVSLVRQAKYRYILNGLLCGAAVGAGFAVFESAGYAFEALLEHRSAAAMESSIHLRGFLAPFAHVAWTAIAAGAFWRVKQDRRLNPQMFFDKGFLKAMLIPVILHMIWNSPLPSPLYLKHLLLGLIAWFVVFGLAQQGLRQVREQQQQAARTILASGRY
jgi:RsiW-degrading membrane proteinase PrsW (M82 family)